MAQQDINEDDFNTAAQKVMAAAPKGLPKEQLFALIAKELDTQGKQRDQAQAAQDFNAKFGARQADPLYDYTHRSVPMTDGHQPPSSSSGGVIADLVNSPTLQGMAHPQDLSDLISLLGVAGPGTGSIGAGEFVSGMKRVLGTAYDAMAGEKIINKPGAFLRGGLNEIKLPPRRFMPTQNDPFGPAEKPSPFANYPDNAGPRITLRSPFSSYPNNAGPKADVTPNGTPIVKGQWRPTPDEILSQSRNTNFPNGKDHLPPEVYDLHEGLPSQDLNPADPYQTKGSSVDDLIQRLEQALSRKK